MTLTLPILLLCALGMYVSVHMQAKALAAKRGELTEPSVVQSPRAALIPRIPNSTFGIVYYVLLAGATFFVGVPVVHAAALAASVLAAAVSFVLAYSLLFITRMPCAYCWTGHVVNWLLLALLAWARM